MKTIILPPEQIIVPGEYDLGNEAILKIYFRVFDRGQGEILPPVVVVNNNFIKQQSRQERLQEQIMTMMQKNDAGKLVHSPYGSSCGSYVGFKLATEETKERYRKLEEKLDIAPYYLIDGNHRTAAATLTHSPIYAIELENNRDLDEARKMAKRGELFGFDRTEHKLEELVFELEEYLLSNIDDCRTVKERIDELISNGDLPEYMKEKYQARPNPC